MTVLLLQTTIADYSQWGIAGAIVFLVIAFMFFVSRSLPTWERVRTREISVREEEAKARTAQASSFSQLSDVLNSITVKQQQETEAIRIMQRVAADATEQMESNLSELAENVQIITRRLDMIEKAVTGNSESHAKRNGPKAKASPTA